MERAALCKSNLISWINVCSGGDKIKIRLLPDNELQFTTYADNGDMMRIHATKGSRVKVIDGAASAEIYDLR